MIKRGFTSHYWPKGSWLAVKRFATTPVNKVHVVKPIVAIDGDDTAHLLWNKVKDQVSNLTQLFSPLLLL